MWVSAGDKTTVSCDQLSPEPCYVISEGANVCLHSSLEVGRHIVQLSCEVVRHKTVVASSSVCEPHYVKD